MNKLKSAPNSFELRFRKKVKGIWNKRLELLFGFIPALMVFIITYGKKFR